MVKVSFIVPVYNSETYLSRCIDSILNQTLSDFELILINDGSKDNSLSILNEYQNKDKRIKLTDNKQNQGQSVARNKGLKEAQGEYIMFVDSDDYIHPQTAEILYAIANKNNYKIVASTKANYLSKKQDNQDRLYELEEIKIKHHNKPLETLLKNSFLNSVVWNKIYSRELIKDKSFIEGIYFEDWPWTTCLFSEIKEIATINIPLYTYNNLNVSTMRSPFTEKKIKDYAHGIRYVYDYFSSSDKKHLWPLVRKHRISQSIKMMINKTYHEDISLYCFLLKELKKCYKCKLFYYRELQIKVCLRLIKIRLKLFLKEGIND